MKIAVVVGTRPNFVKAAPLLRAMKGCLLKPYLVHTGQHYSYEVNEAMFKSLGLPEPSINLEVGSGSFGYQVGNVIDKFSAYLASQRMPFDLVVVFGDVNSTLGATLGAVDAGVPVAHVEAGCRSHDRSMQEEINRIIVDKLSELLFVTSEQSRGNLVREGVDTKNIYTVGNIVADVFRSTEPKEYPVPKCKYALVTIHRDFNTDNPDRLQAIADAIGWVAEHKIPVVFPVHPRTVGKLKEILPPATPQKNGAIPVTYRLDAVPLLAPFDYAEMKYVLEHAAIVITDSGGLQVEAALAGTPCITVRPNTEWTETIISGWNTLAEPEQLPMVVGDVLRLGPPKQPFNLWREDAAPQIVKILERRITDKRIREGVA